MKISSLFILILTLTAVFALTTFEETQTSEPESPSEDIPQSDWAVQCDASHFELVGKYTLGKQDQLNRTFTHVQQSIKQIGNVTWSPIPTVTYRIFNTQPTFYYRDSKQKADILGNDTIVVYGGRVQVDVTFNWSKTTSVITRNGSGSAFGLSDMISFAKQITIQNGSSYSYDLLDADEVTWNEDSGEPFHIKRIDPADATEDDKDYLRKMFNNIMGQTTVRNMLEAEIDKIYHFLLRNSLHDEHHHVDPQFDYHWTPRRNTTNYIISMKRRPLYIDIEKDGIRTAFDVQAEKATKWECGDRRLPHLPLNPEVYGSLQNFVTFDFYENMLRFAIEANYLDTDLSRQYWESKMFQFYAGDLYEIFPLLQTKYYASEPVEGNCKATYSGLKVRKSTHHTFNVTLQYNCELNVKREKIVDFSVGLELELEGNPHQNHMHHELRSHTQHASFYPYADYKMQNQELAELMVQHSLNRLYEVNLFGNNYPVSPPRDYPHMIVEDNFTIVYDSSHIDPDLPEYEDLYDYLELKDME